MADRIVMHIDMDASRHAVASLANAAPKTPLGFLRSDLTAELISYTGKPWRFSPTPFCAPISI